MYLVFREAVPQCAASGRSLTEIFSLSEKQQLPEDGVPWKEGGLSNIAMVLSRDAANALGDQTNLLLPLEEGLVAHSLIVTTHSKEGQKKPKEDHFPGGRPTSSPYEAAGSHTRVIQSLEDYDPINGLSFSKG